MTSLAMASSYLIINNRLTPHTHTHTHTLTTAHSQQNKVLPARDSSPSSQEGEQEREEEEEWRRGGEEWRSGEEEWRRGGVERREKERRGEERNPEQIITCILYIPMTLIYIDIYIYVYGPAYH